MTTSLGRFSSNSSKKVRRSFAILVYLRNGFSKKLFTRHRSEIPSIAPFLFPVAPSGSRKLSACSTKRGQNLFCEKPHLLDERFIGGIHEPKIEIVGPGIDEFLDLVADLGGSTDHSCFYAGRGGLFSTFSVSPGVLAFPHIARIARHVGLVLGDPCDIFARLFHCLADAQSQLKAPVEVGNVPACLPGGVGEIPNHRSDGLWSH